MYKVGDLVRRVKVLSLGEDKDMRWLLDHSVSDSVGVVLEVEEPNFEIRLNTLEYPECFVKVLWQTTLDPALKTMWHWGEELEIVKKTEESS
jgi:hypothetical protein|tara:strand:- start:61 stop:336 length:276 start_codon:yes stop_codon:yes gene_type:complete